MDIGNTLAINNLPEIVNNKFMNPYEEDVTFLNSMHGLWDALPLI